MAKKDKPPKAGGRSPFTNRRNHKTNLPTCRGFTKAGKPCRARPLANGFCANHGGQISSQSSLLAAKRGERTSQEWLNTRGLYSDGLFPEEIEVYEAVKVGTLEEEIRLLKVQLRRAVGAQMRWTESLEAMNEAFDEDPELKNLPLSLRTHLELDAVEKKIIDKGSGLKEEERKLVRRKRDYIKEIRALVKIISMLEGQHAELMKVSRLGDKDMVDLLAVKLREFGEASAAMMPSEPKE